MSPCRDMRLAVVGLRSWQPNLTKSAMLAPLLTAYSQVYNGEYA